MIILTGKGDPDGAELAIQRGVWDYLLKPSSTKEISLSLKRALKYRQEKRGEADGAQMDMSRVVGVSPTLRTLLEKVAMAGRSEANVLITGETGTGKELFARTVHGNSNRVGGEFVVVDCASLTETLVESTLFGHRRGAFTGAQADHQGLVRMANKGTLFLDEVGEMPLSVQKSFLRVLQERSFRPVGETREVSSDFRLISATNKNLSRLVDQGRFREDLLFRLMTIHLQLPPLRERMEDIHPLADHHVARLCRHYNLPRKRIDQDVFQVLVSHDWPGNVRELFNVLERAFVASGRDPRGLSQAPAPGDARARDALAPGKGALGVGPGPGGPPGPRPGPGPGSGPGPAHLQGGQEHGREALSGGPAAARGPGRAASDRGLGPVALPFLRPAQALRPGNPQRSLVRFIGPAVPKNGHRPSAGRAPFGTRPARDRDVPDLPFSAY